MAIGHTPRVHYTASAATFFALSVCSGPALFLAIGVVTSQLAASRRQAAAYAAGALGVCFALRMAADSSSALSWLRWSSALGWVDQLQPFTSPQPVALALIFGLAAVLASLGIYFAGARDLGASTLPDHASSKPHMVLLFGPVGLTVRLIRPTVLGWLAGICAFGLLLGSVAKQAAKSLEASPSVQSALSRLGGRGGEIKAYLGVSFLIIALLVVLIAAGQITAMRREESGGLIEHLLVRPVSRPRWMAVRLGVAAFAIALGGSLSGVFAWLGVTSQGVTVSFPSLLGAGLNTVPPALCLLGIGALAWGAIPRLSSVAVYSVLAWSFLVELLAGVVNSNHWLLDTSIFNQLRPSPAVAPDWISGGVMIAVGVLLAMLGALAFVHRDLTPE